MAIREGRWDCPSCGSTGVFGRHVDCPSCGKPRPAGVRFYLTDDAPVLVDPERVAEAEAGPDWVCEHCGASNRAAHRDCEGCGAPRGSSPTQAVTDYALGEVPRSGQAPAAALPAAAAAEPEQSVRAWGWMVSALLCIIVLGLCTGGEEPKRSAPAPVRATAAVPAAAAPEPAPPPGHDLVPAVVEELGWARVVYLERRSVEYGEGWELPDSATVVEESRKVRDHEERVASYREVERRVERTETVPDGTDTRTRQVSERVQTGTRTYVCGQRDLGNGYFKDVTCSAPVYETRTRSESYEVPRTREVTRYETETDREPVYKSVPIYGTYYRYRAPVWNRSRVLKEEGGATRPVWPAVKLRPMEREERREEVYAVGFRTAEGERNRAVVPLPEWEGYANGRRVALRRSWRGRRGLAALSVDSARLTVLPSDSLAACRQWHAGGAAPTDSLGCSPAAAR